MKTLFRKALVIGNLLMSSTALVHADQGFSDIISEMVPILPMQEDSLFPIASKYLAQRPFDMKMVKKVAGKNAVFTLGTVDNATDGSYLLLRQSDLKSMDSIRVLNSILNKPTDLNIILDVEADSAGVLSLFSVVKEEFNDGSIMLQRVLPYFKHVHLINSANNVKTIAKSFLYGDKYIEDISFTGFENVRHIEDGFMVLCKNLKSVDLSSMEHLKTIGNLFMAEAKALKHLTLPTTRFFNADLKTVGNHFLRGATSLTHIQEEAFESVTSMGSYFMSQSALESFNTAKFKDLQTLGAAFLAKCEKLETVNVSGLKRIEPARITFADAKAAQEDAKKARSHALSMYKQARVADSDAQFAVEKAETAERGALKHAAAATAIIKTSSKQNADRVRQAAKEKIYTAKDLHTTAEILNAEADYTLEHTVNAVEEVIILKTTAQTLLMAAKKQQRHNLGLLQGCDALDKKLNGIRGVEKLQRALRIELADRFNRPYFVEAGEDDCGC